MATNYPTFQSDPILNSVSASLGTFNTVTASVISASSYLGISGGESAIYVGNKIISGSLIVSSSIRTLDSITSSGPVLLNGLYFGTGKYNTTNSVAIGYAALGSTSTGTNNVGIGYLSAYNTTQGSNNVSLGSNALYNNAIGNDNTSIGRYSGYNLIRGSSNTFIGSYAGYNLSFFNNTTSSNNTFVGSSAGFGVTNALNSVIIGGSQGYEIEGTTGSIIISDGGGNIRIQANSTGLVTIPGTLSVVGGKISFPAVNIPSSDANTLDDYEEGFWTPAFSGSTTTNFTYNTTNTSGSYVKIGKNVCLSGYIVLSGSGTGSSAGSLYIQNLPFAIPAGAVNYYSLNVGYHAGLGATVAAPEGYGALGSSVIALYRNTLGSATQMAVTDLTNASSIMFGINYNIS